MKNIFKTLGRIGAIVGDFKNTLALIVVLGTMTGYHYNITRKASNSEMIGTYTEMLPELRRQLNMFKRDYAPSEVLDWMLKEHMKTPSSVAKAIYSDYLMGDYREMLKEVTIPSVAVYGDSEHLCFGPKVGRYLAEQMPSCRLEVLDQSGHMPFFEQPDEFNRIMSELTREAVNNFFQVP